MRSVVGKCERNETTCSTEFTEYFVEISVFDSGGETRDVEVISGVLSSLGGSANENTLS